MKRLFSYIRRMPLTAFNFLVGCVAISALPPFNGFVSEWLTFQAILQSPSLPQWPLKILVPGVGGLLALSAALAAACFVKAFGVGFLGRARSPAAGNAREVEGISLVAMFALSALCLTAGVLPGLFIDALAPTAQNFIDEFAEVPIDASQVIWITTANDERSIPDPILNRMNVFEIQPPSPEAARRIAAHLYGSIRGEHDWGKRFDPEPADDVLDLLATMAPREMRRALVTAFGNARLADRFSVEAGDLPKAGGGKTRIGFLQ